MKTPEILIADDEANIRFVLTELVRREGFTPVEVSNGQDALEAVKTRPIDLVIMDIRMPKMDGLTALREMRAIRPDLTIVIVTAHGNQKVGLEALESGAYDYFTKPFDVTEVRVVIRRAIEKVKILSILRQYEKENASRYSYDRIIGQSSAMREVFSLIERVMNNDVTVLITGESGTGKEMVASAIHYNSPRAKAPFIKVNTVAIPETLLESEMFGHEKGSFTGAIQQKIGKVEAANTGTLFLDEIGDMPLPLQSKLLRVLQEREIERVGGTRPIKVDIRVVCATNRDLQRCVEQGTFREDLYYRINVLPIYIPALRSRREDIALLVDHFIQQYNPRLGKHIKSVSPDAMHRLITYPWPGNVRELENMVQRAMLMTKGSTIDIEDLPPSIGGLGKEITGEQPAPLRGDAIIPSHMFKELDLRSLLDTNDFSVPLADRLQMITDHIEKFLIRAGLEKAKGHRQETADMLGISRKSLHNKMTRYGMFDE